MDVVVSFGCLSLLLLAGKLLRVRSGLFQRLYLPASVIGGVLGLVLIQLLGSRLPAVCTAGWSRLPGLLINVVFAALFLGITIPPLATIWRRSGPQLAYGQIVAWGQYIVGLAVVVVILGPLLGTSPLFGVIVPVGFEGGHGTAGGLAESFRQLGWSEGTDYGLASATVGIVSAIVIGMALINWAVRRGILEHVQPMSSLPEAERAGLYPEGRRPVAGRQPVVADSVDSLALQLAIVGLAVLIGFGLKQALIGIETAVTGSDGPPILRAFPLFPLCMIGGLLVQLLTDRTMENSPIDRGLMQRLGGLALDFLVVAAISTIRLSVVAEGLLPFAVIVAGGILWNVFCILWLARRLLPNYWFERAIAEMGQSMGVTATGLLLLRVVDPKSESDAPSAFGYKQLLHEPFMGGGLWTSTAVLLVATRGAGLALAISIGAVLFWLVVWALVLRPRG